MKLIYVDEAGTSAVEDVTIVVGVMVGTDNEWRAVAQEINTVLDRRVPPSSREGFIFHATEIYSGGKKFEKWTVSERMSLLKDFLSIPVRMKLPIAIGMVDKKHRIDSTVTCNLREEKMEHLLAYMQCVTSVDRYLKDNIWGDQLGVLIGEDAPGMKRYLKLVHEMLQKSPIKVNSGMVHGYSDRGDGYELKVSNIIDCPHFVEKHDAVMLQLADACAFAFRRYFLDMKNGDELIYSMLGKGYADSVLNKDQWGKPTSGGLLFLDEI